MLNQKITIGNRFQDQFVPLTTKRCDPCGPGSQHDARMTDTQETSQHTSYLFPIYVNRCCSSVGNCPVRLQKLPEFSFVVSSSHL